MAPHDMRIKAIFAVALLATYIAHKWVCVTMATNVDGEKYLIIKSYATVQTASL